MIDLARIKAAFQEAGVETYLVVLKDPDSDFVARMTNGSTVWLLGAAAIIHRNLEAEWDAKRVSVE